MPLVKRNEQHAEPEREVKRCAYEPCNIPARIRLYKGNSFKDVCINHYDKLFQAYAHEWCERRGLHTTAQKIAFCKKMARSLRIGVPS